MDEMKLESLKARIARAEYVVDHDAVAEAIVRRLVGGRQRAEGLRSLGDALSRTARLDSGDVLEAG
jgi:hypothetical protein